MDFGGSLLGMLLRTQPPARPGREGLPAGWCCWSAAWVTQGRDRGCWPGLCRVPGGRQGSGKSRCGGGQREASAHPGQMPPIWPASLCREPLQ